MRELGAGLVVLCCTLMGRLSIGQSRQRSRVLEGLVEGLELMQTELESTRMPMPELLGVLSLRCPEPVSALFERTSKALFRDACFQEAWNGALEESCELCLRSEERQTLEGLGPVLGKYEAELQIEAIGRAKERLRLFLELEEKDRTQKNRISTAIGAGAGITLAVMLM